MFKVLFATDGSESAAAAQLLLATMPFPPGTPVRVVCAVVDWWTPLGGFEPAPLLDVADMEASQKKAAQKTVTSASEVLRRKGLDVSTAVLSGQAGYQIIRAAEEFEADLVVVGSKGLTGLEGFVLGSVARGVAHHAPCSVLIAREVKYSLETVVLALDGSSHAAQALRFTAALPLPTGSKIRVLSVVPTPGMLSIETPRALVEKARVSAHDTVESACEQLAAAGKIATHEIKDGDPATEILAAADDQRADLIIAGARGHSFIEGLLVGSVADRLLKKAKRSVLLVR
jgi:nucleotide-binding universal stress UspA family protein